MKKIFNVIISLFAFLIPAKGVSFNAGDSMTDILDELEQTFDKMNFDGSFDRSGDQKVFNALVRKALDPKGPILGVISGGRPPMATGDSSAVAQGLIASSQGDLNVTVTRESVNIAANLPYVLFGANDFRAQYASTLAGFLPTGVTAVVTTESNGDILFTYTAPGPAVDTIRVSFNGLSNYAGFLASMNTTYFRTRYVLYSISDVANLSQFFQNITFGNLTSLGMKGANQLSPNSRKLPSDFQDDRVNLIFPEQDVNPDFSFVQNFGQFTMSVQWDIFMSQKISAWKR